MSDAGMSVQEILAEQPARPAKPKPSARLSVVPVSEEAAAAEDLVEESAEDPAPEHDDVAGIAYERHGTTSGYSAGCRLKDECPGIERVGQSCTTAVAEYQRKLKAQKAENAARAAEIVAESVVEAQEPAVEPIVVESVESVAEPESVAQMVVSSWSDPIAYETASTRDEALRRAEERIAVLTSDNSQAQQRVEELEDERVLLLQEIADVRGLLSESVRREVEQDVAAAVVEDEGVRVLPDPVVQIRQVQVGESRELTLTVSFGGVPA